MGRKKLPGVHPRTINLDIASYESILTFWRRTNTGLSGALVVRQLLKAYGELCQARLAAGNYEVSADVGDLRLFASRFLEKGPGVTR